MLWISGIGVVPLSGLWLISHSVAFLIFVQAVAGIMWGMWELATLLLLFDRIPQRQRTSVLTMFNVANAVAMVGGSLLGAAILSEMGETMVAYELLFGLSVAARLVSLVWLTRVVGPESRPRRIRIRPLITRDVAVRPQVGSIDPPIIAGIERVEGSSKKSG
jgi:MFS family permease